MLLRGANHVITFDAKHDMDARPQWSPAGHVNHGCYPNCAIKKKRGGLWLTSIRPIEQGEELLIDYDFDLGEEFEPCRCGHPRCRGLILRRKDWPKLRKLMSKVAARSRNQRSVRTILLAAAALAVLTGCQSAGEKQRLQAEAQSGDLANCARIRVASSGCGRNSGFTEVYVDNMHKDHRGAGHRSEALAGRRRRHRICHCRRWPAPCRLRGRRHQLCCCQMRSVEG
jgi:hypothetical protein